MKLYIVVHENASGPKDSVDTKLYLTEDAAEEGNLPGMDGVDDRDGEFWMIISHLMDSAMIASR